MEKLIETIARYLVDDPDSVSVRDLGEDDREEEIMQLCVASDDMGKVIGKQGRIAKALRTVVKAAATKEHTAVNVEIVSNEEIAELDRELSGEEDAAITSDQVTNEDKNEDPEED